jgi:hypothetical protein
MMDLIPFDERSTFLNRLRAATDEKRLTWTYGASDYWLKTTVGRFSYAISSDDSDDYAPFTFRIYPAPEGQPPLEVWTWDPMGTSANNTSMRDLYNAAKSSIMKFDVIKAQILDDLAQLDGGPASLS